MRKRNRSIPFLNCLLGFGDTPHEASQLFAQARSNKGLMLHESLKAHIDNKRSHSSFKSAH
jgi:hypothetical protein